MNLEQQYAEALFELVDATPQKSSEYLQGLTQTLKQKGHQKLLPKIFTQYESIIESKKRFNTYREETPELVLTLEEESVRAIILGDASLISEGMIVESTGQVLSIPVSDALLGRVVSPLGEPLDGLGAIASTQRNAIEREAYGVMDRHSVNQP